jgi:hypothetical protein
MGNSDEAFYELLTYGVLFILLVIALFLISRLYVALSGTRGKPTVFGMDVSDVEKLKTKGGLTDEEAKAIRAAMSRRLLERVKEEEKLKKMPSKAEAALAAIDKETALRLKAEEEKRPAAPTIQPPRLKPTPPAPKQAMNASPPASVAPTLREELQPLLLVSEIELEDMLRSGFISAEDFDLLRTLREKR